MSATSTIPTTTPVDWYRDWILPHLTLDQDPLGLNLRQEFKDWCSERGLLTNKTVTERAMEVYAVMAEAFGNDDFLDNAEYVKDWLESYEDHKTWFPEWWCYGHEMDGSQDEGDYYITTPTGERVPSYEPPS